MIGRGEAELVIENQEPEEHDAPISTEVSHTLSSLVDCYGIQARRLEHVSCRMRALEKSKSKEENMEQMSKINNNAMHVVMNAAAIHDEEV